MPKRVFFLFALLLTTILTVSAQGVGPYYVQLRTANVRACPRTSCRIITALRPGTAVTVLEPVRGQRIGGDPTWYRIRSEEPEAYIHSLLVSTSAPRIGDLYTPEAELMSTPQPPLIVPVAVTFDPPPTTTAWMCNCSRQCTEMVSCEEAYFQMRICGCAARDEDGDGVPCENVCT